MTFLREAQRPVSRLSSALSLSSFAIRVRSTFPPPDKDNSDPWDANNLKIKKNSLENGGEGGIRTPDGLAPMPHFECGAFNHSATSPRGQVARIGRGADITIVVVRDKCKLDIVADDGSPVEATGPGRAELCHRDVFKGGRTSLVTMGIALADWRSKGRFRIGQIDWAAGSRMVANPTCTRIGLFLAIAVGWLCLLPDTALAHAADRGHVLLLPTGYYLIGGASAVALTILVLGFAPVGPLQTLATARLPFGSVPDRARLVSGAVSFLFLATLVVIGFAGSRDPLSNPLPLVVWTVFWVGITLVQGIVGDVWRWLDPWYAPARAIARLTGQECFCRLPRRWAYRPAIVQFLAFAWFELVHPAPDDPAVLATAGGVYFLVNLAAAAVFGHDEWSRRGEALSAFLNLIARLGIVEQSRPVAGRVRLRLRLPGAGLVRARPLPLSGAVFLLAALGSVSYDGLMRTFFWLGLTGVNPLEFPGRTAVAWVNTSGLLAAIALLVVVFLAAVRLGQRLAGSRVPFAKAAGMLVWSVIPISLAYHFSHYLTALVINGQYALAALSDPLMTGADLFGTAGMHVRAGALMGAEAAWLVWNLQAFAIIAGHLLAVLAAHLIAARLETNPRIALLSQLPLGALMVAYTVLGLWLLSSPTGF